MALMEQSVFEGFADRMASQYGLLKVAFDALSATGTGTLYYDRLSVTDDPDIELSMLDAAYNADQYFLNRTAVSMIQSMVSFTDLVPAFVSHVMRVGTLNENSWNAYCEDQDVRVSDYTNQVYYARYGTYLRSCNVFCETDTTFATVEVTGSETLTVTDGSNFGTGAAGLVASGTNFAGTQLKAIVTGSNTISALVVDIEGLDENGDAKILEDVTIAGAPDAVVTVGSSTDRWVDVTDVVWVSGGVTGDIFELHNIKERNIAL